MARRLRGSAPSSVDLSVAANVFPARTKQVWVGQCLSTLEEAVAVALSLGTHTSAADRVQHLDARLRGGTFLGWLRTAVPVDPRVRSGAEVLAQDAADVLEAVQREFKFFADRARPGWRFGQLHPTRTRWTRMRQQLAYIAGFGALLGALILAVSLGR
jgi:hypothetical protein